MNKSKLIAILVAAVSVVVIGICVFTLRGSEESAVSPLLQTTQSAPEGVAEASGVDKAAAAEEVVDTEVSQDPPVISEENATQSISAGEVQTMPQQDTVTALEPSETVSTVTVSLTVDASAVDGGSSTAHVSLDEGATVFDALATSGFSYTSGGAQFGKYVSAIGGLAEKQHGPTSGWTYTVNGDYPQTSCSNYVLSDGDAITWIYKLQA